MSSAGPSPPHLVIVGASARAAAFSALRAGYRPSCVDLFGDTDLAARCLVHTVAPEGYPNGLDELAARFEPGPWMYTGAIENHPALIARISQQRRLWGNDAGIIGRVRDPDRLGRCLADAGLPHVACRRSPDGVPTDGCWLVKPIRSAGGSGITPWIGQQLDVTRPVHFQERIDGDPRSAVFVGNGTDARLLGVTWQLVGEPELAAGEFAYCGSIGPLAVDEHLTKAFVELGRALTREFRLRGLFGVDCQVRDGAVWAIEVNPRYTASVEVIEYATGLNALALHEAACVERVLPAESSTRASGPSRMERRVGWPTALAVRNANSGAEFASPTSEEMGHPSIDDRRSTSHLVVGKAVVFAPFDLITPSLPAQSAAAGVDRLPNLADIPRENSVIPRGQPVLTVFATADNAETCRLQLLERARAIVESCRPVIASGPVGVTLHG